MRSTAYVDLRERIERGEATWTDFAGIFTDDAVYIDPAYGRVEGLDAIRRFLDESMRGLEDWRFPIEFTAVDGDNVIIKWTQLLPNGRRQSGYTRLIYAGRRQVPVRGGPAQHGPRPGRHEVAWDGDRRRTSFPRRHEPNRDFSVP